MDSSNKANEKKHVLVRINFDVGQVSIFLPMWYKQNEANRVPLEYIDAKKYSEILSPLQISCINKDIKNVWPGAEKKIPPIENRK